MTTPPRPVASGRGEWGARAVIAIAALAPTLLSSPGRVSADSRQYLYLDPGAFLERAVSLWDPSIAAGTVPHQHLGFLWPMGPWFWLTDAVGLPVWVGQRLWLAAVVAAAGFGAQRLARALGCGPLAALVVALAYQLTPYQLAFTARLSVLLLPWAALPWLVHLARRSVEERTWRAPLSFGLVAGTAGAVNASSLILVLLGPAAVFVAATVARPLRHVLGAGARVAVATGLASAWWLGGVLVQGRYGLPVLQLTENVDTVAAASRPDDIVRGLGNWIFTSTDGASTAIDQAAPYATSTPVRLATILLPALAVGALAGLRFRWRGAIASSLAIATIVGVGPAPLGSPSAYGDLWRTLSESSSVGLALRNTPRVVPVIVLATALALGLGLQQLVGRIRLAAAGAVLLVVATAIAPVATEGMLDDDFDRPGEIPERWLTLAADLDAVASSTTDPGRRVLELPGANFAAYTWGNTVEPVLPGLVDRPTIAREVLPAGGFGTADLLGALDRRLLNGTFDPSALAPVARLLGVGDVVIRGDIDSARFGLPSAALLIERFDASPPPGFQITGRYGDDADGRPQLLRLTLDRPTSLLRVDGGPPLVLAGNGDGIVDAAAAGIIDGTRTILPATSTDTTALDDALERNAELIVTDTNRKTATTFFYTIADDVGATEIVDAVAPDPTGYDVRFGPYADAGPASKTVAVQLGGTVTASMEGGPERPEHRAVNVFDHDPETVWRPRAAPVGQFVEAHFDETVATDSITIRSTPEPAFVRAVRLVVDGTPMDVELGPDARSSGGQVVPLPAGSVQRLRVELTAVEGPPGSEPGLADVDVGTARVDEALRLPTELVDTTGERADGHRLSFILSRLVGDAADPGRRPVERNIDRIFHTPVAARYELTGTVSSAATSACRDDLVSIDGAPVAVEVIDGALRSCGPIDLASGEHRLTAAAAAGAPEAPIDRIVLTTGPAPANPPALTITDPSLSDRHAAATVDAPGPFWFTLAESRNDGWEISVSGGSVRSASMTDGYANGWLVEPSGNGPVRINLAWGPQRIVWAGFAVTGLLVPMIIVVFGGGRRRRATAPPAVDEWQASSFDAEARLGRIGATVLLAAVWTAGWWFVSEPTVAAIALAGLVVRTVTPQARWPLAIGASLALVAAELTDRPTLVFVGLALALAEIAASARAGDQGAIVAWNDTPG